MNTARRLLATNPLVVDGAIALALAALWLLAFVSDAVDVRGPAGVTVGLLLLQSLPLALRRRFPVPVFLVVMGATAIHLLLVPEGVDLPDGLGVLIALYTVGERFDRRISLGLLAVTGAIVAILFVGKGLVPAALPVLIQTELVCGIAWLLGDAARIRRLYTTAVEERARLIESERSERARAAVLEERERIARELHDAVAHHVSVVVIQAGAGLRAVDSRPDDARAAFEAVDDSGRKALADMRRMVSVLGDGTEEPMPGLDRLGDSIEQVRAAGLAVELSIDGERPKLDPELETSAFRIIQEALTNSLKHAGGGGRAQVTVRYEPNAVSISIDDQRGPDAPPRVEPAHDGRGLVGMRERVTLLRGTFAAEPTAAGFRVSAILPMERPAEESGPIPRYRS